MRTESWKSREKEKKIRANKKNDKREGRPEISKSGLPFSCEGYSGVVLLKGSFLPDERTLKPRQDRFIIERNPA